MKKLAGVTRVEVITDKKAFSKLDCKDVQIEFQDNHKTLKVFIK